MDTAVMALQQRGREEYLRHSYRPSRNPSSLVAPGLPWQPGTYRAAAFVQAFGPKDSSHSAGATCQHSYRNVTLTP